ncbi:22174_t:CDS:2 [Entrophospora sp. SA101]|nr:22174_t:CDS:2 [Entrophospora sp. SA101]
MREVKVGDTVFDLNNDATPLAGYQEIKPNVYSNLYPSDSSQYKEFKKSLEELQIQDSSLSLETIDSQLLGPGFRCGFLGLLHREIICERLQKEFNCEIINTPPSITYRITFFQGEVIETNNPQKIPSNDKVKTIEELFISLNITTPEQHLGAISQLCQNKRVDILLNNQLIPDLSFLVYRDFAYERAKVICENLKETLNRQTFTVPIQACIGKQVIARETLPALKKHVTDCQSNYAGSIPVIRSIGEYGEVVNAPVCGTGTRKTLQEYLNWKYPTREEREQVERIDAGEIRRLEGGELDLSEYVNVGRIRVNEDYLKSPLTKLTLGEKPKLTYLDCSYNLLTNLDLSQCPNLTEIYCSDNQLTSINFLKQLPHPEKLNELELANNNIEPTNLEFLRPFINLKYKLTLGNDEPEKYRNNIYNRFYGSLEPLRNMTKLPSLCIDGTDIDEGLEYLPDTVGTINCDPKLPNQKVVKIQDQLRPYNYDLSA